MCNTVLKEFDSFFGLSDKSAQIKIQIIFFPSIFNNIHVTPHSHNIPSLKLF